MTMIASVVTSRVWRCGRVEWTLPMRVTPSEEVAMSWRERLAQEWRASLNPMLGIGALDGDGLRYADG
jgi:hypothetical protein